MPKRVKVANESDSGRNLRFHDDFTSEDMTRAEFVRAIKRGDDPSHHARVVKGGKTPAANLDGNPRNNLGRGSQT